MNKTVTINISGIIFHIEEDAFEKLSKYLGTIKSYFKDSEGRDEIMSDIESRIAELLKEKVSDHKQVVLMADVDHVISVMGKPEDYAGETSQEQGGAQKEEEYIDFSAKRRRRVFRDPDDKVLGGVCSGISNYFDIDPLWLRLALVVFTLLGGAGILIYIILWIVIPKAKTTAEKLEMRGEKVTVNNIKKSVEEEMEHLRKKGKEFEQEAKNFTTPENRKKIRNGADRFFDFLVSVGTSFIKVAAKVLAVVLIIVGVFFTIALLTSVFGISNFGWNNGNEWLDLIFIDNAQSDFAIVALLLVLGIPFLMLAYGGIRLLFGIRERNRIVNIVASSLWFIGLILGLYVGVDVGTEFNEEGRYREVITLNTKSDTLYLRGREVPEEMYGDSRFRRKIKKGNGNEDWEFINMQGDVVRFGQPDVSVERSPNDSFQIEIIRYSFGFDEKGAVTLARNIRYNSPEVNDSLVTLEGWAEFNAADKWRAQDVKIIIRVPKGKSVFLSKSLENLIWDIKNVHNIWDGDMMNRAWIMTDEGLDCGDCKGLEKEIHIEDGEIHIKDGDKEIHINPGPQPPPPPPGKPTVMLNEAPEQLISVGVPLLRRVFDEI